MSLFAVDVRSGSTMHRQVVVQFLKFLILLLQALILRPQLVEFKLLGNHRLSHFQEFLITLMALS